MSGIPSKHHLCPECLKERIDNKLAVSPNLWCFHEYSQAKKACKKAKQK